MDIIRTPEEMTAWANARIAAGNRIALVPTMGFFHDGHLALMREAKCRSGAVVVSLFVNPLQFGPGEDLSRYPRNFEGDAAAALDVGVDVLFVPEASIMYPEGACTRVVVSGITDGLCGASRPGHFTGVATVVAKLFHIVKPHVAIFGEKDFQQLAVIRRMVRDLNWDIAIIGHPTVREPDGLAMSSRNTYLSPNERATALCLYHAIEEARTKVRGGERDATALLDCAKFTIKAHGAVTIDYVRLVSRLDLAEQDLVDGDSVLVMAVKIGSTRLIDNARLLEEN